MYFAIVTQFKVWVEAITITTLFYLNSLVRRRRAEIHQVLASVNCT